MLVLIQKQKRSLRSLTRMKMQNPLSGPHDDGSWTTLKLQVVVTLISSLIVVGDMNRLVNPPWGVVFAVLVSLYFLQWKWKAS